MLIPVASSGQNVAAAAPSGFFGGIANIVREFWAEDPSWTNPGNGGTLTTVRDNGSLGEDLTAGAVGSGSAPTFVTVGAINSKPAFRFVRVSATNGGYLTTANGSNTGPVTVVIVGQADAANTFYFTDSRDAAARLAVASGAVNWATRHTASLQVASATASDTAAHLVVAQFATNDAELWLDNTSLGTDTSGTYSAGNGFVIGANAELANQVFDGDICYVAVINSTADASGFSAWLALLASHYGITLA